MVTNQTASCTALEVQPENFFVFVFGLNALYRLGCFASDLTVD